MTAEIKLTEFSDTVAIINKLLAVNTPNGLRDDLRELVGGYMTNDNETDPELKVGIFKTAHLLDQMLAGLENIATYETGVDMNRERLVA